MKTASQQQPVRRGNRGFSIVEMLVAFGITTVILAAATLLMSRLQETYGAQQRVGGANETGRTAMELLALDIGQAGFPGTVSTWISQSITASGTAQAVTMTSMAGIYVGRVVTVDRGSNAEAVRIVSCTTTSTAQNGCTSGGSNTLTGVFKLPHADNTTTGLASPTTAVPVTGSFNPFPEGVLFDLADTAGTFSSTQSILRLIGDLRGDGSLRYIEYRFTADANAPTSCTGTLVRSDTDAYAATQTTASLVADNLCNTSQAGIFNFTTPCQTGVTLTSTQSPYITLLNTDFTPGSSTCRPMSTTVWPSPSR